MKEKTVVLPANDTSLSEFNCICRSDPLRPDAADAMKPSKIMMEVVANTALIALPGDLLYLYFVGSWYEPMVVVKVLELGMLFLFPLAGIFRFYVFFGTFIKHIRNKFNTGQQSGYCSEKSL